MEADRVIGMKAIPLRGLELNVRAAGWCTEPVSRTCRNLSRGRDATIRPSFAGARLEIALDPRFARLLRCRLRTGLSVEARPPHGAVPRRRARRRAVARHGEEAVRG